MSRCGKCKGKINDSTLDCEICNDDVNYCLSCEHNYDKGYCFLCAMNICSSCEKNCPYCQATICYMCYKNHDTQLCKEHLDLYRKNKNNCHYCGYQYHTIPIKCLLCHQSETVENPYFLEEKMAGFAIPDFIPKMICQKCISKHKSSYLCISCKSEAEEDYFYYPQFLIKTVSAHKSWLKKIKCQQCQDKLLCRFLDYDEEKIYYLASDFRYCQTCHTPDFSLCYQCNGEKKINNRYCPLCYHILVDNTNNYYNPSIMENISSYLNYQSLFIKESCES